MPNKYRGVHEAIIVTVCEGDGTRNDPYREDAYVVEKTTQGAWVTRGKIVPLNHAL